jgi:ribonuclease P protein subunit RPR2
MAKAKVKPPKGSAGSAQSHIRARIAYLHKASTYLQAATGSSTLLGGSSHEDQNIPQQAHDKHHDSSTALNEAPAALKDTPSLPQPQLAHLSRQYLGQMRGVSLKTQLRLSQDIKRSVCKRCEIILVPGSNCTDEIENLSRGKKKPWADVRVIRCASCGTSKRFPQTSRRSSKLPERRREKLEGTTSKSTKPK